jgi:hypothetical protein
MSIDRSVGFYSIKVISVFIVSILYFITGSIVSLLLDEAVPDNDPVQQTTVMLLAEVSIIFGVIGVLFYMNRMLIKKMPFFLDGYFGFRYSLLHDAASGMIVGYILYAYQDKLISKLKELRVRYTDIYDRVGQSIRSSYHSVF